MNRDHLIQELRSIGLRVFNDPQDFQTRRGLVATMYTSLRNLAQTIKVTADSENCHIVFGLSYEVKAIEDPSRHDDADDDEDPEEFQWVSFCLRT